IMRLYRKILALYGPCIFESKLKRALLKSNVQEVTGDILAAIERAWELGRVHLASQLLPVLARWSPADFWRLVPRFLEVSDEPPPALNVIEGLGYLAGPDKDQILELLVQNSDRRVADSARAQVES